MLTATLNLYKKAYSGLSRETWLLAFVIFINRSGTMVISFMSIYCTQKLHYSIGQVGTVMSMFGAGAIIGSLASGRIVDKVGFYYMQFFTLLFGGSLFFWVAELENFVPLCIGVFFLSLINESFRPANSTAIAHYSKEENRTRSYSVNRLAINLGFSFGAALGGFLAAINYHWLFWVDGATNIIASFLLLKLLPPVKQQHKEKEQQQQLGQSPYKDGKFLFFIALLILFGICFMQLFSMQPVFLKTVWNITEQQLGMLMALNGVLIVFVELVMIHALENRKHQLFFIRMGIFLFALGFVSMNILHAGFFTAAISMVFLTFGEMLTLPFMNSYWMGRTKSNNRGRYAALYTAGWSIAQIAAPAIGAGVVAWAGFNMLWWAIGGMCTIIICMAYALQKNDAAMVSIK